MEKNNNLVLIENFIEKYVIVYADDVDKHFVKYNAKDILQQYTQGIDKTRPEYKLVNQKGPAHKPEFEVSVIWQDRILATSYGKSKKEAEQNGAYEACKSLGIIE